MEQEISEEQKQKYESYLNIHLKENQTELPPDKQIELLEKRDRNKWFHLLINVAAVLLFGYSFYYGITQLSQTFFIIIMAVFGINVVLIFYQKKQIKSLIDYLKRNGHE
jgi:amino acid transporter